MAIENERKYVLDHLKPQVFRDTLAVMPGATVWEVQQGYLDDHSRVRQFTQDGVTKYTFTMKRSVKGKLIEIETEITQQDFVALWDVTHEVIAKTRVRVPVKHDKGEDLWEVDFFKTTSDYSVYLIMAELEMPDGQEFPSHYPKFITDYLLYSVPQNDNRFYNKNLTRPRTIERIIEELRNGKC